MLFRSQNSESIVNLSKCISVSVKRDGTTTLCINGEIKDSELYSIMAKTENSGNIILGIYNNYESAKIAMNFIQNSNNSVYHNIHGYWGLREHCSENIIIDMPTQEWIDNIPKENN